MQRDRDGLQVDFMAMIDGVKSYEGLRSRAATMKFGGHAMFVADLRDIARSKRAAGRGKDLAVLDILEAVISAEKEGSTHQTRNPKAGK